MTKQNARERMKVKRASLSEAERARKNQAIRQKLFALEEWKTVRWFYPFVSYGTEVDTVSMIQYVFQQSAWEHRIRVAVPRVQGEQMDFYEITSLGDLKPGYHGILEPSRFCPRVEAREGLMLLPGLAFDWHHNRVGYGGGYYDRYLEQYGGQQLLTVAVAYDFQIVDSIEAQEHDIRPQKIIIG